MDALLPLVVGFLGLAFATDVVFTPERYLRRRTRDAYRTLVAHCGGSRAVADRLVVAERKRGATSGAHAARLALARLLRERER